jgi:methylenetetrahydromethanopterin dehydrogenase
MVVKLGIAKLGNIVSGLMTDLLLDERADREDFEAKIVSSGTKLTPEDAEPVVKALLSFNPDLVVVVSPNAAVPGPTKARTLLKEAGKKVIVISDNAKLKEKLEEEGGFGYILINADAMIGARREFLDPVEMAIYNAELMKVLAGTGAFRVLQLALDGCLTAIKEGRECELPKVVMTPEKATIDEFCNPYARSKAIAAYEMAAKVADINVKACFMTKEWEKYVPLTTASHEMMRYAAKLVDEAREIEKADDSVKRMPHAKDGRLLCKTALISKPE